MNKDAIPILIVEDDSEIASLLQQQMENYNFKLSIASNGKEMDRLLENGDIQLILMDIGLPGEDGLSICKRLRQTSGIPIIMLTAQSDQVDKIIGLELGADDYVVKPFSTRELVARIRAILRRGQLNDVSDTSETNAASKKSTDKITFFGWTLNINLRQLHNPQGVRVVLTTAEFDLLCIFCRHAGKIMTRDTILEYMPHRSATGYGDRSIDVLISRLRQKLEPSEKGQQRDYQFIKTVRLGGYLFTPQIDGVSCPS